MADASCWSSMLRRHAMSSVHCTTILLLVLLLLLLLLLYYYYYYSLLLLLLLLLLPLLLLLRLLLLLQLRLRQRHFSEEYYQSTENYICIYIIFLRGYKPSEEYILYNFQRITIRRVLLYSILLLLLYTTIATTILPLLQCYCYCYRY